MYGLRAIIAVILVAGSVANAGVLPRQIQNLPGSAQCNQARLAIVNALSDTNTNVQQIQDPATQQAASAGVQQAAGGIRQIAQALQAGQAPPAASRDTVGAGLTATTNALAAGDATDPAVAAAQQSVSQAAQAGNDVVALC